MMTVSILSSNPSAIEPRLATPMPISKEFESVYQAGANSNLYFTARSSVLLNPHPRTNLACSDSGLVVRRFAITSKERHDWQKLCLKALKEPDPEKQGAIVAELNRILQNESKKAEAARVNRVPRQRSA